MYEAEANRTVESVDQLPAAVRKQFCELRGRIDSRTVLPWGEHCTECVWPTCYTSCDFYSPREDGRCRRFLDGMVRIECEGAVSNYVLKIRFKQWGKLWSPGNTRILSLEDADKREKRDQTIASVLHHIAPAGSIQRFGTQKRYGWKKRMAVEPARDSVAPDQFVIECYNPGNEPVDISLTMRPTGGHQVKAFQKLIHVAPGFHREEIATEEIRAILDLKTQFSIDLTPNDVADGTTLFFGLVDFVKYKSRAAAPTADKPKAVKCVVWDLDHTLWSGILVEDGAQNLRVTPGIPEILKELDRRGILLSIASKNNSAEAMAVLKREGLDEYFLYPQISWAPKSEGLKAIARQLNIGIDTLLFVDDSEFERAEVSASCPSVTLLDAARYLELTKLPCCQVTVTEESTQRRKMYRQEAERQQEAESFGDDYFAFLRDCRIELHVEPLSQENIQRVHELTQRTNQMNFSGNRYQRGMLDEIAMAPYLETYVISCRDRFGNYGIVGFSVVDSREPRMTDLMFSCRVQSKRVEHAFLSYLLSRYMKGPGSNFWANYRKTPRNAPSGQVFADIGMEERGEHEGLTSLMFPRDRAIPDDGIIKIVEAHSLVSFTAHVDQTLPR